jgi:hypothetical protein
VKVTGEKQILAALKKYKRDAPEALAAAVYLEAVGIMAKSVHQVPVEFGVLRRSHYVTAPQGADFTVELGYGTNYAVYVHERTGLKHHVGKAKFLEDPLNEAKGNMKARLLLRTKENIEKGRRFQGGAYPTRPATSKDSAGPKHSHKGRR